MASNLITITALINTMIGPELLILPLLFIKAGLINSIIITSFTGVCIYYSCRITYNHINNDQRDFVEAIERHQKKQNFPYYNIFSSLSDQLIFYGCYNILVNQWITIFYDYQSITKYIPYIFLITFFIWNIVWIKLKITLNLMSVGIVGLALYFCFVNWMFIDSIFIKKYITKNNFPLFTAQIGPLNGIIASAITIQSIFFQILKKNSDVASNKKLLFVAYFVGTAYYIYAGIIGGYGILNRESYIKNPNTVTQYFPSHSVMSLIIQIVYFIKLYAIYPEWNSIHKTRVLKILKIQQNDINSMVYFVINHVIGCTLILLNVKYNTITEINGGICLFITVYVIPVYVHLKCTYFNQKNQNENTPQQPYLSLNQQQQIQQNNNQNEEALCCKQNRQVYSQYSISVMDKILLICMVIYGIITLIWTIYNQFK